MDLRIGLAESPRELTIELPDDASPEDVKAQIEAAVSGGDDMAWVTDKRGRQYGFKGSRVTYAEVSSATNEPRIGFGAS